MVCAEEVPESLLCFEAPIPLSVRGERQNADQPTDEIAISEETKQTADLEKTLQGGLKGKQLATTTGNGQLDEILDSVLPPRTFETGSGEYQQFVAKTKATRQSVVALQEELEKQMERRQARHTGLCAIREDLHKQAFDEIIRQVILNEPERGLILLRVRDEARMTMDAYKTLYESSIVFGIRKQLEAEQGMSELEEQLKVLEQDCAEKGNKVSELRNKLDIIEKRHAEVRDLRNDKRKQEVEFLKYQGQNLDQFLKSVSGSGM